MRLNQTLSYYAFLVFEETQAKNAYEADEWTDMQTNKQTSKQALTSDSHRDRDRKTRQGGHRKNMTGWTVTKFRSRMCLIVSLGTLQTSDPLDVVFSG